MYSGSRQALRGADGVECWPNFYARRWEQELQWYAAMGLQPNGSENTKGERLVTSQNRHDGAFDSAQLRQQVLDVSSCEPIRADATDELSATWRAVSCLAASSGDRPTRAGWLRTPWRGSWGPPRPSGGALMPTSDQSADFSAPPSAVGYLYQVRLALL